MAWRRPARARSRCPSWGGRSRSDRTGRSCSWCRNGAPTRWTCGNKSERLDVVDGEMSHTIVLGGGLCGLSAAMLLARDGRQVTVLERDASPIPEDPEAAWEGWRRDGVVQFRQAHYLQPL